MDPPLRPIISQIGTAVYDVAKQLNDIITPYMPKERMIESSYEFIEICKTIDNAKFIASLDVESLFTNVPVKETIDIIIENVYNNPDKCPPNIPKSILEKLLLICTTKSPFKNPNGELYVQTDGVSMGSPLAPTLANFYMCNLENKAFTELTIKPKIYCRYVDDCFIVIDNIKELHSLKNYFENNSVLKFTFETEINKKLPFLDVSVKRTEHQISTSVYCKPTGANETLNYNSLCPNRYKIAVIKTFLHRAYAITSSWENFNQEVQRIRKLLINNNFPISILDNTIGKFLQTKFNQNNRHTEAENNINLYYRNQFTSSHRMEEKLIQNAVDKNVKPINNSDKINTRIYYKNRKIKSLFIKNKITNEKQTNDHVVYQYLCSQAGCNSVKYIGYTTCHLAKRFYSHVQLGSINIHNKNVHNKKPFTKELLKDTTILFRGNDKYDLTIAEALLIKTHKPSLNLQEQGFTRILSIF